MGDETVPTARFDEASYTPADSTAAAAFGLLFSCKLRPSNFCLANPFRAGAVPFVFFHRYKPVRQFARRLVHISRELVLGRPIEQ
jgi:hypothetical protein